MTRMNQTPQTVLYSESLTTATLTVSTGTYLAGVVYGSNNGTTNGPGAIPIRAAYENGGAFEIVSVTLTGLSTTYPFNLWLFNDYVAAASTNGSTFTLAAADYPKFIGAVGISGTDYFVPGSGRPMAYVGTGMSCFTASSTSTIVGYLVARIVTTGDTAVPTVAVTTLHMS